MKLAVTGASGFVGRYVCAELQRRAVTMVAANGPRGASVSGAPSVDVHDAALDAFERLGRPDTVIHLAWGGLPNYQSLHHFEQELPAQHRFLKGLVAAGVKHLIVTGTCLEYGMQSGPLAETLPEQPTTPYGFAKHALYQQLRFLQRAHPFTLTWCRCFYVYGKGQAANSLLSQLERAVEQGERVFNMSGGEQLRDFVAVEEAARLIVELALSKRDLGVVNICSGKPASVRRRVEEWLAENGWSIELNLGHWPYPEYEPFAFWGDDTKLRELLEGAR